MTMSEIAQALKPFSTFAEHAVENVDGTWVWRNSQNERICDWFGPSDFGAALSSAAVAERGPDSDRSFLLRNAVTRVSELEAENARLKARLAEAMKALNLIDALDPEEHVYGCSADALRGIVIQMGQIARRVLEGGKVDG